MKLLRLLEKFRGLFTDKNRSEEEALEEEARKRCRELDDEVGEFEMDFRDLSERIAEMFMNKPDISGLIEERNRLYKSLQGNGKHLLGVQGRCASFQAGVWTQMPKLAYQKNLRYLIVDCQNLSEKFCYATIRTREFLTQIKNKEEKMF